MSVLPESLSALGRARASYHERPDAAAEIAGELAGHDDALVRTLALSLLGLVAIDRAELRAAIGYGSEARRAAEAAADPAALAEALGLSAQLSFFTGALRDALHEAELCVAAADETGDLMVRIHARRSACLVIANLDVPELATSVRELLALTIEAEDPWEEAVSRNDLAHMTAEMGDVEEGLREIERAFATLEHVGHETRFARGALGTTHGEILLTAGRPAEAVEAVRAARAQLVAHGRPNPYLLGANVHAEVRGLVATGRVAEAAGSAREAMEQMGEAVPQIRGMILRDLAAALAEAGMHRDAYVALAEGSELERIAYRELTEVQRDADVLATKNRELEALHTKLRDQAERDWLTGLHNRRYLAGALEQVTEADFPISLAAIDLDHFKAVNDRFGHDAGDRVLARTAELLTSTVRAGDVVVRAGGEEFVVVMPRTDAHAAGICAERLRREIGREPWRRIATGIELTTSVGVVTATEPEGIETLLQEGDRRLYAAKAAGRNCVIASG